MRWSVGGPPLVTVGSAGPAAAAGRQDLEKLAFGRGVHAVDGVPDRRGQGGQEGQEGQGGMADFPKAQDRDRQRLEGRLAQDDQGQTSQVEEDMAYCQILEGPEEGAHHVPSCREDRMRGQMVVGACCTG